MTTGTTIDQQRLLILHAIHVAGQLTVQAVAQRTNVGIDTVQAVLTSAYNDGLAEHRRGRIAGWVLTPQGRATHLNQLAADVSIRGARPVVEQHYRTFLALNEPFKQVCTRWQVRATTDEPTPNDHTDPHYDAAVIADLGRVHQAVLLLIRGLATVLPRFDRYSGQLDAAWQRLLKGERRAFVAPLSSSYHDLWMELHQDLISTLGHGRSAADGH